MAIGLRARSGLVPDGPHRPPTGNATPARRPAEASRRPPPARALRRDIDPGPGNDLSHACVLHPARRPNSRRTASLGAGQRHRASRTATRKGQANRRDWRGRRPRPARPLISSGRLADPRRRRRHPLRWRRVRSDPSAAPGQGVPGRAADTRCGSSVPNAHGRRVRRRRDGAGTRRVPRAFRDGFRGGRAPAIGGQDRGVLDRRRHRRGAIGFLGGTCRRARAAPGRRPPAVARWWPTLPAIRGHRATGARCRGRLRSARPAGAANWR